MAYIQIKSDNPNMSYCLSKNPNSNMLIRQLKNGHLFGWFSDDQSYNVYFKDADDEISFKQDVEEEFEYLNVSRYSSLLFVCSAMNEMSQSVIKKDSEYDKEDFTHSITIGCAYLSRKEYIESSFKKEAKKYNIDIEYKQLFGKYYTLTFTSKSTLRYLMNYVAVYSFIVAIINKNEHIYTEENLLQKYAQMISHIDAPYFVRYLFKVYCIKDSHKIFNKLKPTLDTSQYHTYDFKQGSLHKQRINFITDAILQDNIPVIDVGCGEGAYVINIAKKLQEGILYYAYDIDEEQIEIVMGKCLKRQITNVKCHTVFQDLINDVNGQKVNIILSEVIEHMPEEESKNIINFILNNFNVNKIFITTPNKDFNVFFYDDENEMRHKDHHYEMRYLEFETFINQFKNDNNTIEIGQISDVIDNIQPTSFATIQVHGKE